MGFHPTQQQFAVYSEVKPIAYRFHARLHCDKRAKRYNFVSTTNDVRTERARGLLTIRNLRVASKI